MVCVHCTVYLRGMGYMPWQRIGRIEQRDLVHTEQLVVGKRQVVVEAE